MCWIVWSIFKDEKLVLQEESNINNMLDFLAHRWPDSRGIYKSNNIIFWATRLSVMDLSDNANMPFVTEDGSIVLTYNWEITNYQELNSKYNLKNKYNFKSSGDTENLAYLYKEIGITRLLEEIDWYFAFSIFDKEKQKVYIVRDFYWTRPVFYTEVRGNLYFASEIKSLLQINWFEKKINKEAIFHYFWLWYIPGELTAFKWINELDWGHFIEYDLKIGDYKVKEYYKIKENIDYNLSFEDAKKNLFSLVEDSISRNTNSDALLGSTLSGWIDTSVIVGMLKHLNKSKALHTFSIKVNESSFDESRYQKIMSDYAETIHHEIVVNSNDIRENLHRYMSFTDEPYADWSAIPTFLLAKEAKKYVKVLLSGEWWDENFSAYETHQAYLIRKKYNSLVPNFIRSGIFNLVHKLPVSTKKLSFDFKAKRFTEWSNFDVPTSHYYWRHILNHKTQTTLFRGVNYSETVWFFRDIYAWLNFKEDLSKLANIDFKLFLIWDLMIKNDRMIMANSIETRFPFLEKSITDFAFSIPEKFKISLTDRRIIQKEAFKNILPREIYKRPNFGMEIPYSKWLITDLKDITDKYFSKEKVLKTEFIDYDVVESLLEEHLLNRKDNGRFLWSFLNFMIWFELFIETDNYKNYVKK